MVSGQLEVQLLGEGWWTHRERSENEKDLSKGGSFILFLFLCNYFIFIFM